MIHFCLEHTPRTFEHVQHIVHKLYRRDTGKKTIGWGQVPTLYRIVTGEKLPTLSPDEIKLVVMTFQEVDHRNKQQTKKRFAYNYILR